MSSSLIDTYSLSSVEPKSLLLTNVRTIVKFYIWPLLVLFGLTGNCLSILVLTRRRLIRTSTNNYLTILAAFDSCYLIFSLLLNIGSYPKISQYSFTETVIDILRPLADFSSNTATWLIVCFTLERTLAVARPIYAKRTCSVRRSRHVICTLLIICFLITLPTFFEKSLKYGNVQSTDNNVTRSQNMTKQQEFFFNLHRSYLVLYVLLLSGFHFCCYVYVHRSRHFDHDVQAAHTYESYQNSSNSVNRSEYLTQSYHKSSLASSPSLSIPNASQLRCHSPSIIQKRRVTIILIFCLSVAVLLWTPQSLSLTYETLVESYSDMSHQHRVILLIFNNFANLFLCINASIDFILYCFLSEKFARTCKQILFRQCSNHKINNGHRPRLLSFERTSFILANPANHIQQQQLAVQKTNKYYIQLYDFYRNSSGFKRSPNRKSKKKLARLMATNTRNEKHIFYQKTLAQNKQKIEEPQSLQKSTNILSNPVLDFIDENDGINQLHDSRNTLMTDSSKQSRAETLTNV